MSTITRHVSRSNSSSHHHRQHSDNFLIDTTSLYSNKWLHSSQDYGTGGQRSRSSRSLMSSNTVYSRSSSLRRNAEDQMQYAADFSSSGLLDLHSFDSELLPEKASNMWDGYLLHQPDLVKNPYNSESNVVGDKLINRYQASSENSLLQSFSADKERSNPVAKIKVVVRKRPLNKKEIAKKEKDIITIERNCNSLTVHETKLKVDLTEYVEKHEFVFDAVLDEGVSNDEVYSQTVEPIVPLIFQRTKATCFAYGQTGSGKTYTMQPLPFKASQDILKLMLNTYRNQGFQLFVSFFEIYGGKLFDLLNDRRKLCMREDGKQQVCIVGLQEYKVSNVDTIKELIDLGNSTRSIGTTGANEESSRSHAILQLAIKRLADNMESKPARLVGKLSFIDLAGSERGADTTDNDKQTRIEGAEINKSLLALKECIRALDNDQNHIPFRGSKLTEVLRDSFVGDSRTVMISCISPSSGSCEHTLNTLRYADRVKSLSKGASSKKDLTSSSISTRDSTTIPALPVSTTDSSTNNAFNENNRFGWSKDIDQEASPPLRGDYSFSNLKDVRVHDRDHYEEPNVHEKSSWMYTDKEEPDLRAFEEKNEVDNQREVNRRLDFGGTDVDDDLIVLLKEEEDLVTAHRRQVEETMEIVREEMSLLAEADQPGNQLDDYVSKLSYILSQKAAGILQLQTRLAQFHRRLTEYNVLVSSGN